MSTNHRRRQYSASYSAGTSALAASGLRPGPLQSGRGDGRLRNSGGTQYPSSPAPLVDAPSRKASAPTVSAPTTSVPLPGNVVELYPNSVGHGFVGPRSVDSRPVVSGPAGASPKSPRTATLMCSEAGMATAEYAIATLAAVGFAGLLVFILRSDEVRGFLLNLIRTALALP
ncbi:uncharacterized protein DUF4244 [Arthrobacter sp. SLBN-83]|uniref:DUF4244 domain-containing protein n=1 Tax=Arthrobacter sp. SLBN-83 TaxID=2768449 RepID=UPI00115172CB|nr:DUF4244 domain-containing protein [Arthrobacter sp. SLBN-83]TQJ59676.1 uncharacterized protein DUF4244 [Arthrobacter sp. SLBN-83]